MKSSRNNPALGGGDYALGMVTWNLGKDWELPSLIEACEENAHIRELWRTDYPWRELFDLLTRVGYRRYTLAEIPASSDAIRLMRYYEALWSRLKG